MTVDRSFRIIAYSLWRIGACNSPAKMPVRLVTVSRLALGMERPQICACRLSVTFNWDGRAISDATSESAGNSGSHRCLDFTEGAVQRSSLARGTRRRVSEEHMGQSCSLLDSRQTIPNLENRSI